MKAASSACALAVRTAVPELQNGSNKKHCHLLCSCFLLTLMMVMFKIHTTVCFVVLEAHTHYTCLF